MQRKAVKTMLEWSYWMMQTSDLVRVVWDYLRLSHPLKEADVIIGFGSYDTGTAERAAQLWLRGMAPMVLFSGGLGKGTEGFFAKPEADTYAEIAAKLGVDPACILAENKSSNSGENMAFSKELLRAAHITPKRMIVVHKPYMERRVYATLCKQWPGPEIIIAPNDETYEQHVRRFVAAGGTEDEVICSMVGDLQRIAEFPKLGYQIPQDIPPEVWDAYLDLVERGYTRYVLGG